MKTRDWVLVLVIAFVAAVSFVALLRLPITPVEPRKVLMEKVTPAPIKEESLQKAKSLSESCVVKGKEGFSEVRMRLSVSVEK